jgi:hypothetical protein
MDPACAASRNLGKSRRAAAAAFDRLPPARIMKAMDDLQLDLFSGVAVPVTPAGPPAPTAAPAALDDAALIAAIPLAGVTDAPALAAEAGRRRLAAAVPALEALCRRLLGYGLERLVPEQAAALRALAEIGTREAAQAVVHVIAKRIVQGPTLGVALAAAVRLRAHLPGEVVQGLMRHPDPAIRADVCRCARPSPEVVAGLIAMLGDADEATARAAACALGRMGRSESLALLRRRLREAPSAEVIAAVVPVADEDCIVLLGRIVRVSPSLADAALDALDSIDHPRAGVVAAAARAARAAR